MFNRKAINGMVLLAIQERDLIQDVRPGKQSPATLEELLSTFRPANGFGLFRLTYQAAIADVCNAGLEASLLPKLEALFDAHNMFLDEAKQPVPAGALEQHCLAIDALIDIANSAGKHLKERGAAHSDDAAELIREEASRAGNKTADEQPEPAKPTSNQSEDRQVAGAYPSAKTYARDEWIYKNIHLNSCDTLSVKLNKKAKTEKWAIISSRNGLKNAADRHADYHELEKRRFKKH